MYTFNQPTCTPITIIVKYVEAIISINADPLIASRNLQIHLYLIFLWIKGTLIENSKLIKIDPILLHSTLKRFHVPTLLFMESKFPLFNSDVLTYKISIRSSPITASIYIKSKRPQLNN